MRDKKILGLLAATLLLMVSCTQYHAKIRTTIHEDGSCERTVDITSETHQEMEQDSLCEDSDKGDDYTPEWFARFESHIDSATMVFDDSWKKSWCTHEDTTHHAFPIQKDMKEEDLVVTARQDFSTVDEMCKKMPFRYNGRMYDVKGELKKSFKWFYTEYTYTETYKNVSDMFVMPLSDYMEDDVASYWLTGTPNLTQGLSGIEAKDKLDGVEAQYDKWVNDNLFNDICNIIEKHYDEIAGAPVSKETFHAKRKELFKYMHDNGFYVIEENGLDDLFSQFFHTKVYSDLMAEGTPANKELEKMVNEQYISHFSGAEYALEMPGDIIDAGKGKIENGKAIYPLSEKYFLQKDYVITATSRKTHYWAYIILFIVLAVAIGSFIYRKKK